MELMIFLSIIGYCFVIANALIGLSNIRDLNNMKGDLTTIKFHKWYGRIELTLFYLIFALCITLMIQNPNILRSVGDISKTELWVHNWVFSFYFSEHQI